jgi:long-subunit fatty acid transport protein
MRNSSSLVAFVAVFLAVGKASASTDINGLFDGRSHGMGGTGVAFIDSAGAIPINPALLDQIGKLTITLDVFGIAAQPQAPYTVTHQNEDGSYYQTYETIRSKSSFAPLPFLGAAYRLHDRVVLGLGAYPVIGQGTAARYRPAPDEFPDLYATNKARMGLIEVGEALSIRLLDNLSMAVMWRITYMTQSVSTPVPTPGNERSAVFLDASDPDNPRIVNAKQNISGLDFKGFQFGLFYRPIPNLRLGFTYRSKVEVWGKGETRVRPFGDEEMVIKTEGGFKNPHTLRGGFALSVLEDKLLLAADFKYLFYAEAFKELKQVRRPDGGEKQVTLTPAYWYNSWVVQLGTEYKAGDIVALRTGYTVLKSATNPAYAPAFMAPAGHSHLVTAGLGFKVLDSLNIDVAGGFVILQSMVNTATEHNAGIGKYASRGGEVSLAATYHR